MSMPLSRLIEGMIASLRDTVLPEVTSDFARGQLEASLNLLATMALRAEWSPAIHQRQLAHQAETFARLAPLLAGIPEAKALLEMPVRPEPISTETLAAWVAENSERAIRLIHLINAQSETAPDLAHQALAILDQGMKDGIAEEWRNTADNALAKISRKQP